MAKSIQVEPISFANHTIGTIPWDTRLDEDQEYDTILAMLDDELDQAQLSTL